MRIDRVASLRKCTEDGGTSRGINLVLECMVGVRRVNSASNLRMCTPSLIVHIKVLEYKV